MIVMTEQIIISSHKNIYLVPQGQPWVTWADGDSLGSTHWPPPLPVSDHEGHHTLHQLCVIAQTCDTS